MTVLALPLPPTEAELSIQILSVPGCPNVEPLLRVVERSLEALDLPATIERIEGPHSSPTLVVDGVALNPGTEGWSASCRLDLPTEEQILDALTAARAARHGCGPLTPDRDLEEP